MTLYRRLGVGVIGLVLSLAACVSPIPVPDPPEAPPPPVIGGGASRQILSTAPTETVRSLAPTRAPTLDRDAPPPTPLPSLAVPLIPPQPTLAPPPRPQLSAAAQSAADANAATAVALATNATATAAALPTQEILIQDLAFSPTTLSVIPGTIVLWRNLDRVQHQVQGGEFDSGRIQSGSYWASTLGKPGRYAFICSFHPTMRAEIEVAPDDSKPQQFMS